VKNKGFTLIELMIVVAIIGILAAIAIPNFLAMQLRAKRSELPTNVDAIRTAEKAYHAEWDSFTSASDTPATLGGRQQVDFTGGGYMSFENLGWTADGKVRGQYNTTASNASAAANDDFTTIGIADVDGDGANSQYNCNRAEKAVMVTSNNVY